MMQMIRVAFLMTQCVEFSELSQRINFRQAVSMIFYDFDFLGTGPT